MKQRILTSVLVAVLGLNLFLGARLFLNSAETSDRDDVYRNMENFTRVLEIVRKEYVDEEKVSYEELVDNALKGMLSRLDPHSEYMDPKRFTALRTDTRGEFGGVGIVVSLRDGMLTVVAPMDGTPGAAAGILAGDRIIKIEDKSTRGMSLADAVDKLRGKVGTEVRFTLGRTEDGEFKEIDVAVKRAVITVKTVRDIEGKNDFKLLENQVGYVRLASFGDKTGKELELALKKMDDAGIKGLVLDLRDNPGGLLDQSVIVAEKFLPKGQLVVSTEGREKKDIDKHHAAGRSKIRKYPVVILVNKGSASASEIVAGCLQDLKRADLVGEKTFGKGSVQSILPMRNGAALRLTTAKYYTPSHRVIHEKGITPDHEVKLSPETMRDLLLQRSPGGLESLPEADRERVGNAKDTQLEKALELLKVKLAAK
ncbi:MAG: carboxyl-terminal protease [Verrucomicrobiales bacterium]|nr:carboxyl-terminal protease [Verrucomicrobiales bacterium]|tara:strand:+ start:75680 stop:76957 length:1278 start_codon:yes stop_codon:yes gene_type:complete